jgi:hypothetical protein
MSISCSDGTISLVGDCPVEDAETLLALLMTDSTLSVDVSGCGRLHTSVVQVLLAARPRVTGIPVNAFAAAWVLPHVLDVPPETTSIGAVPSGHSAESSPE